MIICYTYIHNVHWCSTMLPNGQHWCSTMLPNGQHWSVPCCPMVSIGQYHVAQWLALASTSTVICTSTVAVIPTVYHINHKTKPLLLLVALLLLFLSRAIDARLTANSVSFTTMVSLTTSISCLPYIFNCKSQYLPSIKATKANADRTRKRSQ